MEVYYASLERVTDPLLDEVETKGVAERMVRSTRARPGWCRFFMLLLLPAIGMLAPGCFSQPSLVSGQGEPLSQKRIARLWEEMSEASKVSSHGPLTVERAIEEALRASPELEQIRRRSAAAEEQVKQADAAFYPRLVLAEDYNTTDNPVYALMNIINQRRLQPDVDFNHPGQQQNFSTQVRGQWSVFEGGRRFYEREATLSKRDSLEADLLSARNELVGKVTETYYRWLRSLDFIDVADNALKVSRTNGQLGENRLRAGVALPSEVMRLKARTAEARGDLVAARTGARSYQAALERLIVRPIRPEEIPESKPLPSPLSAEQLNSKDLVKEAIEKRPEIAALRSLIEAARMRVLSVRGTLLPQVGTSALYQWDSENLSHASGSWMVSVLATWPLFEGGARLSQIREAREKLMEIEARGEQVALDIALEVHQATLSVQASAEKIQAADERRKYAQSALKEVQNQYRNEVVTVDSLLQAEVSWKQAEASYTASIFDGKIAHVLLRQALGEFAHWLEASDK
jgi:outer membrane protein TolC